MDPGVSYDLNIEFDVLDPVFWLFIGILVTFVLTRIVTRRIRAREARQASPTADPSAGPPPESPRAVLQNVSIGGVHIHHQVVGILLMLGTGIWLIAARPDGTALNVVAVVFGMGVSLAFDEFALWLHLEDVYWTPQGRKSVDAIFVLLAVTGVLIAGVDVFPVFGNTWGLPIGIAVTVFLALVCLLKGKVPTGLVGIVLFPIAIVGALRLAKPDSWWARRWYQDRARLRRRAARRFGPAYDARWNRLRDLIAGAPHLPSIAATKAAVLGLDPPEEPTGRHGARPAAAGTDRLRLSVEPGTGHPAPPPAPSAPTVPTGPTALPVPPADWTAPTAPTGEGVAGAVSRSRE
jgi:hypothetical protein